LFDATFSETAMAKTILIIDDEARIRESGWA
jgi:hypothetical protein